MGVYIKGMEMPKSCWDCYFQDCGNCILNAHKVVDKCIIEDRTDDDCPLVPVPPHGRLIDADVAEVISFAEEEADGKDFMDGILYAADWISKQPTIIPASGGNEDE